MKMLVTWTQALLVLWVGLATAQVCVNNGPLGMITGKIQDWQITASSTYPQEWDKHCHEKYARIYLPNKLGWCAKYKSSSEWLQVDLGVAAKVTGLMTQGRGDGVEWVTAFMASYSMDAFNWQYVTDQYGNQRVFEGNVDSYGVKHSYLDSPIIARFIKFHTVHWHRHPSMRVEVFGCQLCKEPIGLPPYGKMTASSFSSRKRRRSCQPDDGNILSNKAWCSKKQDENQWIQVDVGPPTLVTGILTKGREDTRRKHWVTRFKVSYSNDTQVWYFYKDANHLDAKYDGTLLHESVLSGSKEITQILIDANADVNAQNKDGRTPLHLAARSGNEDIVRSLLKSGAKTDLLSNDRRSCLHVAVWKNHEGVVHQLTSAGACVNREDMDGWTPLFWAVRNKSLPLVRHLVNEGASLWQEAKHRENVLTMAFLSGEREIVNYLVKEGAELSMLETCGDELDFSLKQVFPNMLTLSNVVFPDSTLINLLLHGIYHPKIEACDEKLSTRCLEKIDSLQKTISSLATYCRRTVRSCVRVSCEGRAISKYIHYLPVPEHMKGFLLYEDVLQCEDADTLSSGEVIE